MGDDADSAKFSVRIAWAAVIVGFAGFAAVMLIAGDNAPPAFDSQILLALRVAGQPDHPLGPHWLHGAVRDITSLGSTVVLALVTLALIGLLLLMRRGAAALFALGTIGGGQVLSSLLKYGIDRPRPEVVSHLVSVHTPSFPSGHSMMSAIVYLTLALLAARILPHCIARAYVLGLAVVATLLVGLSRLYLGVHWPTDVLGGWCLGFAWTMACWLAARRLRSRSREDA